jgi:ABC-type branched-subunit amino acid transport system ATPase component
MDHGGLMASVVLDEPSLGLSPVLVTEIFRCPMSALGHKRTY